MCILVPNPGFEGQFLAEGGEQFLLIGSLPDDRPIGFSEVIDPIFPWAYYFIDDVYLAPCVEQIITRF